MKTNLRFLCAIALILFGVIVTSGFGGANTLRADDTLTITVHADPARTNPWEGWGCSLSWWANAIGGGEHERLYADLFFSTGEVSFLGEKLPGLGMNIVRYNIGGGGRPGDGTPALSEKRPDILPPFKDIDGFWITPGERNIDSSAWDWTRDDRQLRILKLAVDRGARRVEFWANAPMWWMNDSRSSAGGGLLPEHEEDFAYYLARVVEVAKKRWHLPVDAIEPFNEPSAKWWKYPCKQEGCTILPQQQARVLAALARQMHERGLDDVIISASDENTMTEARDAYTLLSRTPTNTEAHIGKTTTVSDLVGRLNVHAYYGLKPWRDNAVREALRKQVGTNKRIWMSEYGDHDGTGMELARTIIEDIKHLGASAWVYWQPVEPASAWGLVNGDYENDAAMSQPWRGRPLKIYNKYYVFAQFSRFIKPGMRILETDNALSIAAYDESAQRLVIIVLNEGSERQFVFETGKLRLLDGASVSRKCTTADGVSHFADAPVILDKRTGKVSATLAGKSLATFVIEGIAL